MRDVTLSELEQSQLRVTEADVPLQMDHEAFAAFYGRTARPLWRYLARITGDRQHADDLLQETYYRFLRAEASYQSEAHRRNSLYMIATNLARDGRRRAAERPRPVPDADEVLRQQPAPGTAAAHERTAAVRDAMGRLRPRDRSLLWLAYGEGSTHREIADTLGVKACSVKLLLFRARRRLAALLGAAPAVQGGDHA
jgi:RNA polymerase sigma-70 factor (ECF subfamily)